MDKEELIKELEELRDIKEYSQSELLNTGYRTAILDAIDLVKKLVVPGVGGVLSEWDLLDEEDGNGPYCCGKRMVDRGIMLVCLNCDAQENSSS